MKYCNGCTKEKPNTTKLVMSIADDSGPYVRRHIVYLCPHCLAEERRLARFVTSTPPGFDVFVQWTNGSWQHRHYIYAEAE